MHSNTRLVEYLRSSRRAGVNVNDSAYALPQYEPLVPWRAMTAVFLLNHLSGVARDRTDAGDPQATSSANSMQHPLWNLSLLRSASWNMIAFTLAEWRAMAVPLLD